MTPPPAALAPSVALERLEDEWRERAKQYYGTRTIGRDVLTNCADELATLRASLAQQGEAVATFTVTNCGPCLPDLDMEWLSDYRTFAGKGPQFLFPHPAAVAVDEAAIIAAYKRGANWALENGAICAPYLSKAASDYADKAAALLPATSDPAPPTSELTEAEQAGIDAMMYGTGFMVGGKRVAPENVTMIATPAGESGADAEDAARSKYEELIYAVASKFPGETRHETALRYIREREAAANEGGAARLVRGRLP